METLPEQFSQALNKIQLHGPKADRASEAHKEVRRVLAGCGRTLIARAEP